MMALPVWKLSVDGQQRQLTSCTRSQSPQNLLRVREAPRGGTVGALLAATAGGVRECCACTEATGRPGRVYMMALPVWKLSVDGQQPELAPCTRSRSPRNLLRVREAHRTAAVGALCWAHARRQTKVLRLHRGYRLARASVHDGPAGVEVLG